MIRSARRFLPLLLACTVLTGLSGCGSDDDNATPNTTNTGGGGGGGGLSLSGTPGITGTYNGTAFSHTGSGVAQGASNSTNLGTAPDTSNGTYGVVYISTANASVVGEILIGTAYWNTSTSEPANAIFQSLFSVGQRPFTVDGVDGARVKWYENGVEWSSDYGTADQTGSSFTIQEVQDVSSGGFPKTKVKGAFTCKVYNGSGQVRTLADCVFVGVFSSVG